MLQINPLPTPTLILVILIITACSPSTTENPTSSVRPKHIDAVFHDVAQERGLVFQHFIGSTQQYYMPEAVGSGVALFDYDADGDLDVYLVQGAELATNTGSVTSELPAVSDILPSNQLYRNELSEDGILRFTNVTQASGTGDTGYGMGTATGDYDNDGDLDLYVTNFGSNIMYRNDGDGTFTDVTQHTGTDDPRWSTSAAFLDYDHDGDLDLYVTNYVLFTISDNKRCAGNDGAREYCSPQEFEVVPDRLFRNEGDGRFTDVSQVSGINASAGPGLGVTCADFNHDGLIDIYVANDGQANMLWQNRGDGRFEDIALMSGSAVNSTGLAEASMGVTAGDADGDGDEDLFMTHLADQTHTLYLNDGQGNFQDMTNRYQIGRGVKTYTGFGTAWFDYDNDSYLDLFIANGAVTAEPSLVGQTPYPYGQPNQLFRNMENARLTEVTNLAGADLKKLDVSRGAAFGDIDNDGDIDIVIANANGPAQLLLNHKGNKLNWLEVRLAGTASNSYGFGARVALLRAEKPILWRRVHADGSYLSASDSRAHFGLGNDASLLGVGIIWPNGSQEFWPVDKANQFLYLREGTGVLWNWQDERLNETN